jgi:GDP-4-dehydro-6-deoxy-D-mannose reductase
MNVFVTGATGFVGGYLVEHLISLGHCVFGTTFPQKPEDCDIAEGACIKHLDLNDDVDLDNCIQEAKPEWIFHLAAVSNVRHSWENRKETLETNIIGTFNLMEAVRRFAPSSRILFISSSDVYGKIPGRKKALSEDDSTRIMSPYAFTKLSGELMMDFYGEIEKLDVVTARPFPHTGPGQNPDFVCSDWAYQVASIETGKSEPVINVGNIDISRDFSDVRDVVKAYTLLMEHGKRNQIYNVSSGKAVSLREILDYILSFSSISIQIKIDKNRLRKADISELWGDNSKIQQETSWKPEIPLKQTLMDLLNYWRRQL